jgi:hypothetical protein
MSVKMIAFWDIVRRSFVEADRHLIVLMMEAVKHPETLVYFNESTWRSIPEGCHHHTCCHDNLKSHIDNE